MDNKSTSFKTETGAELLSRLNKHRSLSEIQPELLTSLNPGEIVEISGESGCGKTEFLYQFTVKCILPPFWQGLELKGLDIGVIYVDTDLHFNLLRLISIIEKRIYARALKDTSVIDAEISQFIAERLSLLFVVKCSSTEQFLITLNSLEDLLTSNSCISCIMIDSISAFYWVDRMNVMHQLRKLEELYNKVILLLKRLMSNYSLTTFVTKQKLIKTNEKPSSVDEYNFLGQQWQKCITRSIDLSLDKCENGKTFLDFRYHYLSEEKLGKCVISDGGLFVL